MEVSSGVLSFLAGMAVRSMALAALAGGAMWLLRVKSAAGRHAGWTAVMAGMLLLGALAPVMPPIPLRVLRAAPVARRVITERTGVVAKGPRPATGHEGTSPASILGHIPPAAAPPRTWGTAPQIIGAVYGCGVLFFLVRMSFGYLFTRRLVQAARPVEGDLYESNWISVPLTVGFLNSKVFLPAGWESWERSKLQAVLAHERTHVRRADWMIALLAGVNQCVYWFHPLAWWLRRRLAVLAEQACDDSALLETGARESYAEALLDMAAAVRTGQGRMVWEAMAMAKATEVKMRIDRILDENRQIPRGLTSARWAALAACSLPLILAVSALQLAPVPAQAQEQRQPEIVVNNPYVATLVDGNKITPADATRLEQYLLQEPQDLATRSKLIAYYFLNSMPAERLKHVYWLIENHPESDLTGYNSTGVSATWSALNDRAAYDKAAGLWRQEAANHFNDARVLANAARFLESTPGDPYEAERLYERAHTIEPQNSALTQRLATFYARAIALSTGDRADGYLQLDIPGFAETAKSKLLNSTDGWLLLQVGTQLSAVGRRQGPLGPAVDLDQHPLIRAVAEFGDKLMERAKQYGVQTGPTLVSGGVINGGGRGAPPPPPQVATAGSAAVRGAAPPLLKRVDPVYPPLARQARISGVVNLSVTINKDGSVMDIRTESGHPLLMPSAMEAVWQWRYAPVPEPRAFTETLNFTLPDAGGTLNNIMQMDNASRPGLGLAPPLLKRVDPVYPPLAQQARISGIVNLTVTIAPDGSVKNIQLVGGHPLLVPSAMEAVRQWQYAPVSEARAFSEAVGFSLPNAAGAQNPAMQMDNAARAVPTRIRVGGMVQAAKLSQRVEPVYPDAARAAGLEGIVQLNITIAPNGHVMNAEPVSGHPLLAAAAIEAVRQWLYQPTLLNGQPIEVGTTVDLTFSLK